MNYSPSAFVSSPSATQGNSDEQSPWSLPRKPVAVGLVILTLALVLAAVALLSRPSPALAAQASQIIVRAHGTSGEEQMVLRVNGEEAVRWTVSTAADDYIYTTDSPIEVTDLEVEFANDLGVVRDLIVDYVDVGGIVLQSEGGGTVSTGTFLRGDGCTERASLSQVLHCSGSFIYDVPASTEVASTPTPTGSTVVVRALGATGEERIELHLNGETLAAVDLDQGWQLIAHDLGEAIEITDAEVHFVNDRGPRDVRIDYLEIDGDRYQSEDQSTRVTGAWIGECSGDQPSSSEWIYCNGSFRYDVNSTAAVTPVEEVENTETSDDGTTAETVDEEDAATEEDRVNPEPADEPTGDDDVPADGSGEETAEEPNVVEEQDDDQQTPDTSTDPDPDDDDDDDDGDEPVGGRAVGTNSQSTNGRYTIAQVIDGTIGAGDGSNPNEESPMGRHDAPLALNQGWNWAQGPTRNSVWGQLGTGNSRYAEFRCAVIPELGHTPPVPFRINVSEGAYYQYANGTWNKGFDVDLTGGNHGGYLGTAGGSNTNPFNSGSHGLIEWRREADGSFSAPWNPSALMVHFWAAQREAPASGQTAEFLTSEVRLQQPDGQTVDLSRVRVLFQCGVDYYSVTGGQGTQVPGPGIGKYHRVTEDWTPGLWVTLPRNVPANSVSDFENWLRTNTPPNVG